MRPLPVVLVLGLLLSGCAAQPELPELAAPVAAAYDHLDEVMDEWGSDDELRLPSSYRDGDLDDWDTAVSYDAALVAIAYAHGDADAQARAGLIADVFVAVQDADPAEDGRVRNSYDPEPGFDDDAPIASSGLALGNMAWVGLALAHVHRVSGDDDHRAAAERLAEWIIDETWDDRGAGGFTGGRDEDDDAIK